MTIEAKRLALKVHCDLISKNCAGCVLGHGEDGDFREMCHHNFETAPDEMIETWFAKAFPNNQPRPKDDHMTRESILDTAKQMVCGHREQDYGSPENNFARIASLWSVYLDAPITPVDVAMMMALLKIARIKSGTGTADSFVDLAGYAACGGEIATGKEH